MLYASQEDDPRECLMQRTAGIDWCRLILDSTNDIAAAESLADDARRADVGSGGSVRPWAFQGYKGHASQSIRFGKKGWKAIIETSGEAAPAMSARMASLGGRCTRLDVQTTLTFSKALPRFGTRCLRLAGTTPRHLSQSPHRVGLSLDGKGYWCGTVGERTEPSYWRIYDKGVEAREAPPNVKWRLEWETKKTLAPEVWRECCAAPNVASWSWERVRSSWKQAGLFWPLPGSERALPPVVAPPKPMTPAWKLALWIEATVSPTIPRLLNVFSVDEVLRMLALHEHARRRMPNDDPS